MNITLNPSSTLRLSITVLWVQCACFIVLYASWILPETVAFRNTAMFLGAFLSVYVIYKERNIFGCVNALPVYLLLGLFAWALYHILFLSQNFDAQYLELRRIWKYGALGAVFALGFGISLRRSTKNTFFWLVYFGICTPVIIYFLKFFLTNFAKISGISIPAALQIYYEHSSIFYIPKSDYVPFLLPALTISLGGILYAINCFEKKGSFPMKGLILNVFVVISVLSAFSIQGIKNGILYSYACILIFLSILFLRNRCLTCWQKAALIIITVCLTIAPLYYHLKDNGTWLSLWADAKVAIQLEKFDHWKYSGSKGFPENEFGNPVSITNYARVAWGLVGLKLALENPMGYGLVEDSFGHLAQNTWPESQNLTHTHSGWIDILVGLGFPSLILIVGSLVLSMRHSKTIPAPWGAFVFWSILAILLLWCTTEAAQTVTFTALLFWAMLCAGLVIQNKDSEI